ncbi:unnamed protein product [Staurois parvus]|uniref:Uncharacterized protein n=1 Tax=Staurois parvus TaxID=386267 RepID=A0ABN9GIT1_9NEOB|nr:unnamed protein product [Staurois parvus]
MQGPGRPDIVNAGSGETRYNECRVLVALHSVTFILSGITVLQIKVDQCKKPC